MESEESSESYSLSHRCMYPIFASQAYWQRSWLFYGISKVAQDYVIFAHQRRLNRNFGWKFVVLLTSGIRPKCEILLLFRHKKPSTVRRDLSLLKYVASVHSILWREGYTLCLRQPRCASILQEPRCFWKRLSGLISARLRFPRRHLRFFSPALLFSARKSRVLWKDRRYYRRFTESSAHRPGP